MNVDERKVALLVPGVQVDTRERFWAWEDSAGRPLSPDFESRRQAVLNAPPGRVYLNDAWQPLRYIQELGESDARRNPLRRGWSRRTIGQNIAKLRREGYPVSRAAAAAYRSARKWAPRHARATLRRRNPQSSWAHLFWWSLGGALWSYLLNSSVWRLSDADLMAIVCGTYHDQNLGGRLLLETAPPLAVGVKTGNAWNGVAWLAGQMGGGMMAAVDASQRLQAMGVCDTCVSCSGGGNG